MLYKKKQIPKWNLMKIWELTPNCLWEVMVDFGFEAYFHKF